MESAVQVAVVGAGFVRQAPARMAAGSCLLFSTKDQNAKHVPVTTRASHPSLGRGGLPTPRPGLPTSITSFPPILHRPQWACLTLCASSNFRPFSLAHIPKGAIRGSEVRAVVRNHWHRLQVSTLLFQKTIFVFLTLLY